MTAKKKTITEVEAIVRTSSFTMEQAAERLDKIANTMRKVLGSTPVSAAIVDTATDLRHHARQALHQLK